MTATGHALVGAVIAAKFQNPYLAFPLSLLSHIACDILPHWDSGTHIRKKSKERIFAEAFADVCISFVVSYIFYVYVLGKQDLFLLYGAVLSAQFLDYISFSSLLFHVKSRLFSWTEEFQGKINTTLDKPWGIVTQVGFVIVLYVVLTYI